MKSNMGIINKVIRILIAIVLITLFFTNVIQGIFGIVLLVIAGVFVLTSIIGVCPLYFPLKITTGKK